ncbi:MAG: hypothetical protein JOZ71_12635 [Ktedonobacteraceae bacterium]|nr:hypothetical protein [Ktedonobacteraceae bacterium]
MRTRASTSKLVSLSVTGMWVVDSCTPEEAGAGFDEVTLMKLSPTFRYQHQNECHKKSLKVDTL